MSDDAVQPRAGFVRTVLQSRWMPVGAGVLGFLEGSFVFFPMEPLFIPAMISRSQRAWMLAVFLVAGNVLASVLMYALGAWAAEPLIEPLFQSFGALERYHAAAEDLRANGFIALFLVGITPFPFQLGTAAAGAIGYSFVMFLLAVTISRGIRYFALAGIVAFFGARASGFIERHETMIVIAGVFVFAALGAWMTFSAS